MERKTQVHVEEGRQDLLITREFELPVALLFKAYTEADLIEQWMGTRVLKLENKQHGGYQFQTSDADGNVLFTAHGTIHSWVPDKQIVRTFQMDAAGFEAQLEFLDFEAVGTEKSKLSIQMIYRSTAHREEQLKLPFTWGINMAHNRLQEVMRQHNI